MAPVELGLGSGAHTHTHAHTSIRTPRRIDYILYGCVFDTNLPNTHTCCEDAVDAAAIHDICVDRSVTLVAPNDEGLLVLLGF